MSNSSRMACSLAPAYFHHWRSNAMISRSRSVSSVVTLTWPCSCAAFTLDPSCPCLRGQLYGSNHTLVIRLRTTRGGLGWPATPVVTPVSGDPGGSLHAVEDRRDVALRG